MDLSQHVTRVRRALKPRIESRRALKRISETLVARALAEFQSAQVAGESPDPWVAQRLKSFEVMMDGGAATEDADLMPPALLSKALSAAAWGDVASAEQRLVAAQTKAFEGVTRATVRTLKDDSLVDLHARCVLAFKAQFASHDADASITGLRREALMSAALCAHDELLRRGLPMDGGSTAYKSALAKARDNSRAPRSGGYAEFSDGSVMFALSGGPVLKVRAGRTVQKSEPKTAAWSPDGSRWHVSMRDNPIPYELAEATEPDQDPIAWMPGARTPDYQEAFVLKGGTAFCLRVGRQTVSVAPDLLPYALTEQAVAKRWMPQPGESGLPSTLEQDVPKAFRYWNAPPGEDAREIRDALVSKQLFTAATCRSVDGEVRRLTLKYHLEPVEPMDGVDPQGLLADLAARMPPVLKNLDALEATAAGDALLSDAWDPPEGRLVAITDGSSPDLAERLSKVDGDMVVIVRDASPEDEAALADAGVTFRLMSDPESLIVASRAPLYRDGVLEKRAPPPQIQKRQVRLLKEDTETEERFVLGVVLEPDTVDAQNDVYDAETVRKSAHRFMEEYRNLGLQHEAIVNAHVKILESYVAPAAFKVNGESVKKGTWILGVRVLSDEIWEAVKAGELTGFSIGGSAIRKPEGEEA